MTLLIIAYLGGILTIVSPCILPVLPFVFSRAGQPFLRSALPMLAGMAITFAAVASLAAVGGGWVVRANEYGRLTALSLLIVFGFSLISSRIASAITQPVVDLGNRLANAFGRPADVPTIAGSMLLGIATGLLWAPCAGPILGLVLTGAALKGASLETSLLLLFYAGGAATSLATVLLLGAKISNGAKRSFRASRRIRQLLGAAVLASVATIAVGLDAGLFARLSYASTGSFEQAVLDRFHVQQTVEPGARVASSSDGLPPGPVPFKSKLTVEGRAPSLDGATAWLNSSPLTTEELRGKVVLVDFWTYSCINCIRTLPYVRAWSERYKDQGLVVIGVHSPEFAFEKRIENVRRAIGDLKIAYPIAVDSNYEIWRAFDNSYWPAFYLIDAKGQIRYYQFGEGDYRKTDEAIQELLREAGGSAAASVPIPPQASGIEAAPDSQNIRSPETYIGYQQATGFTSNETVLTDEPRQYSLSEPQLNKWGLSGNWTVGAEAAILDRRDGIIAYRFNARDLHLVLGPGAEGKPVRFQVTIDGHPPGPDHGVDIDAEGNGIVTATRLYQLVRQSGAVKPKTFAIRFLDPGVQAYAFTFG
ncbi:cytochrome c biogenesis protein DipZ [Oryzifoliimicrobium ureilyticus]|uniref:cytochrome c biogenesis protein DipZ n=1 Tax=Oryzifoliimicrobium ureilyticus TaxID=3113724 RepID=UPI0030767870